MIKTKITFDEWWYKEFDIDSGKDITKRGWYAALENIVVLFGLRDLDGKELQEGDIVENEAGQTAEVKFGFYHHCNGGYSSSAFGVYFDGDEGFYFSEHFSQGNIVRIRIVNGK